jgi:hypothetical protein
VLLQKSVQFFHFAFTDQRGGAGVSACLKQRTHHFRSCAVRQLGQFRKCLVSRNTARRLSFKANQNRFFFRGTAGMQMLAFALFRMRRCATHG